MTPKIDAFVSVVSTNSKCHGKTRTTSYELRVASYELKA